MAEPKEWYENIPTDQLIDILLDYKVRDLIDFCDSSAPSSFFCRRALDRILSGEYTINSVPSRNVESPKGLRRNTQSPRSSRSYPNIEQRLPRIPNVNQSITPRLPRIPNVNSSITPRVPPLLPNQYNTSRGQQLPSTSSTTPVSTRYYGDYY